MGYWPCICLTNTYDSALEEWDMDRSPSEVTSEEELLAEIDTSGDPPTNDEGQFLCSRECADGSQCLATVPLPYLACHQHRQTDPVIDSETRSTGSAFTRICHAGYRIMKRVLR
jgi:hypothetical protein